MKRIKSNILIGMTSLIYSNSDTNNINSFFSRINPDVFNELDSILFILFMKYLI